MIDSKPKTNYLNLILISLAFVIFISGVYYLSKQSVKITEIPIALLPQPTAVTTSTIDPTANWKTYINTKYGFELSYPSHYVDVDNVEGLKKIHSPDYVENTEEIAGESASAIYSLGLNNGTCQSMLNNRTNDTLTKQISKSQNTFTNNESKYQIITYENPMSSPTPWSVAFIDLPIQKCLEITCSSNLVGGCNKSKTSNEFTQILSTFKFTESKDNLGILLTTLNQYLSASLSFTDAKEGKTIDLFDYYNPEFAKYGNKTDLIKKALNDTGFIYDKSLDKTIITTWTSTYKSSTNTCILDGNEENLSLICN